MDKIEKSKNVDFESLVKHIQHASEALQQDARLVINRNVTTRAWLTGFYIVEYEQHGNDRAKYGEQLIKRLSQRLGGKSFGVSNLRNYRQFFLCYPELGPVIGSYLKERFSIRHSPNGELELLEIHHSANGELMEDGKSLSLINLSDAQKPEMVSKEGHKAGLCRHGTAQHVSGVLPSPLYAARR